MAQQAFFTNQPVQFARMDMQAATAPGRYIAQGIQQAAQGIKEGLDKYAEKKKKQEQVDAVVDFIESNREGFKGMNLPPDRAGVSQVVKAVGVDVIMRFADYTQQAKQQEQQMQLQQFQLQDAQARAKDEEALAVALPQVIAAGMAPADETGSGRFDPNTMVKNLVDYGVRPQTALKYAEFFDKNPNQAVQFLENPETGVPYARLGNTLIREPEPSEKGRKAGDVVRDDALGREVVWSPNPANIIDRKTGEPLYLRVMNPEHQNQLVLMKNPKVWGEDADPGKIEIPDVLFKGLKY